MKLRFSVRQVTYTKPFGPGVFRPEVLVESVRYGEVEREKVSERRPEWGEYKPIPTLSALDRRKGAVMNEVQQKTAEIRARIDATKQAANAPQAAAPAAPAPEKNASKCAVTRAEFLTHAPQNIAIDVNGSKGTADMKQFSTGSLGYYSSGKGVVMVNGKACKAQIAVTVTLVGSKELPK